MARMDEREVVARRMRNTGLLGAPASDWRDVVRGFGAMQAQDYGPAKWSLGQRVRSLADEDLDRALNEGAILRTHALRPTWHFVLPEDIRWVLGITSPRIHVKNSTAYRQLDIDGKLGARSNRLIERALRGGNHLTRKEIQSVLAKGRIETDSRRLGYLTAYAELEGVICSGALSGKRHTYALLEERAPQALELSADDALTELTLRYFTSHGPATIKDFAWWSSLKVSDIKRGLEMVGPEITSVEVGGRTYWYRSGSRKPALTSSVVHLLQAYDEYIVAFSETKGLLNLTGIARSLADRTLYLGVVMLDGQVAGHWKRTVAKSAVRFEVALYRPFNGKPKESLEREVEEHGRFLGLPAQFDTFPIE